MKCTAFLAILMTALVYIASCKKDIGPIIIEPDDTTNTDTLISFQDDIQPIFSNDCAYSGCHVAGHSTELDLSDGTSYGLLVNITSYGYPPALRVKPSSADSSVLWHKVANTNQYGGQMPTGTPLQAFEIDDIKKWINQGAQNN